MTQWRFATGVSLPDDAVVANDLLPVDRVHIAQLLASEPIVEAMERRFMEQESDAKKAMECPDVLGDAISEDGRANDRR